MFFFPEHSLAAAGIESHGGIGKEFNNYLMESKFGTNIYYQVITKDPSFSGR